MRLYDFRAYLVCGLQQVCLADRLVCHDDRLSSRKIAYVYYLTSSDWSAEDGGTLDLYESICKFLIPGVLSLRKPDCRKRTFSRWFVSGLNDNLVPGELEKRILPLRNSLVFFFVSDDSFHEVSKPKARIFIPVIGTSAIIISVLS